LRNKNILLIGGSGGIGTAIGESLIKNFNLITASRNKPSYSSEFIYLDLGNDDSINSFCKEIKKKYKSLDGLIFASGKSINPKKELDKKLQSAEIFRELIELNVISFYKIICQLDTFLNKNSSIILISSIGAHISFPNNPGYQASKAALESLARSLSNDLSHKNIRINAIALGYFKTKMTEESFNNIETRIQRSSKTIMNRWGDPDEIKGIINFLISSSSSYITGSTIFIDGGWHIKGL
tara:strand:+ start:3118 stop:3834 length:717 start_codon:yes stop_codon:yes gene_type:complete